MSSSEFTRKRVSAPGFSLIEAIVSIAILALLIGFVASLTEFAHRESAGDEVLGEGVRIGLFVADELRGLGFRDLLKKCQVESVMNATGKALACVNEAGDQLTKQVTLASTDDPPLKVRVNSSSEPDENGRHCVELVSCRLLADGHLLAANLMTSWIGTDRKSKSTFHQIRLIR